MSLYIPKSDYILPEYKNFKYANCSNMIICSDSINKLSINNYIKERPFFELETKKGAYIIITQSENSFYYQIQWYEYKKDYNFYDPVFIKHQVESNTIFAFIDLVKKKCSNIEINETQ